MEVGKRMKAVSKINDGVAFVEKVLLVIMLSAMLVLGFLQVLMRFVFKSPLAWSEGLLTYLFVWSSFLGAALGMKTMSHFCIDALVDALPDTVQRIIEKFIYLLLIVLSVFIVRKGIGLALAQQMIRMPMMKGSMMWPYLSVPVAFGFIGIHSVCNLILSFQKGGAEK